MNSIGVLGVCRLCLSEEFLVNIFTQGDLNRCILDYLSIVVSETDSISHLICENCRTRLYVFRDFRLRCIDVQNVLLGLSSDPVEKDLSLLDAPSNEMKTDDLEQTKSKYEQLQPRGAAVEVGGRELASDMETGRATTQLMASKRKNQKLLYEKQLLKCDICDKMIYSTRMSGHLNVHEGIRPFKCERGCKDKDFHSRHNLHNHYRNMHSDQAKCDICNKVFQSKMNLQCHKRNVHTNRAYQCQICLQKFIVRYRLIQHMKTHKPGDEMWSRHHCPLCDYESTNTSNVKRHKKKHKWDERSWEMDMEADIFEAGEVKIEPSLDYESTNTSNMERHMANHEWDERSRETDMAGDIFEAGEVKIEPDLDAAE